MKMEYDGYYRHYSHLVETDYEVTEKAKEQKTRAGQARMAKENNELLTNWRK